MAVALFACVLTGSALRGCGYIIAELCYSIRRFGDASLSGLKCSDFVADVGPVVRKLGQNLRDLSCDVPSHCTCDDQANGQDSQNCRHATEMPLLKLKNNWCEKEREDYRQGERHQYRAAQIKAADCNYHSRQCQQLGSTGGTFNGY